MKHSTTITLIFIGAVTILALVIALVLCTGGVK